ncbi:MAG TPA: hypothetical protein VFA66_12340 [Gaiellaceae bacterium]|nr:hypothetical protein [Gaiellaceae bacterium]
MRSLIVEAQNLESAQLLCAALSGFDPALSGDDASGYRVSVDLGSSDRKIVQVLDLLERHVTERDAGPARVEVQGHMYTMHPS